MRAPPLLQYQQFADGTCSKQKELSPWRGKQPEIDQERYFRPGELPEDYRLPAHERPAKQGNAFENHQINSCVCTSSRSVLYTGQHIQRTKMFDNTNFPSISSWNLRENLLGVVLGCAVTENRQIPTPPARIT